MHSKHILQPEGELHPAYIQNAGLNLARIYRYKLASLYLAPTAS